MKDVMIDLETLGTTADSVILSIGAVKFDIAGDAIDDEAFYASVSVDSNLQAGRRINEDTLLWWLKQPGDAQAVFHEPKVALQPALDELSDWLTGKDWTVWSNGADFDLPMLSHAFTQHSMDVPWAFWNQRCFRTLKNLPFAKGIKAANALKHNALQDALAQAKTAQAIHRAMKGFK